MPGFAGLVSPVWKEAGQNYLDQIVDKMIIAINRQSDAVARSSKNPHAAFATTGECPQENIASNNRVTLAVTGYIYQDEHLKQSLQGVPDINPSVKCLAGQLLAIYQHTGITGLTDLNGAFTIAIWDGTVETLYILNDRYGIQPCYYWQDGRDLAFASEVKSFAAHPQFTRQINPTAVFDMLAAEQLLGERTLYEGVQALPPASLLTYHQGQVSLKPYWLPTFHQAGDPALKEEEALDEFARRVCQAVQRGVEAASGRRLNLLLTGGLDSRLIAAALAKCAGPGTLMASTIGHERARDVRFGREIARATGMEYTLIPADPAYIADFSRECVLRTEGNMNVHAAWILGASDFIRSSGFRTIMTGVGGESVSGRIWISEQGKDDPDAALDLLCTEYWSFGAARGLMRPEVAAAAEGANRQILRAALQSAPYENPYVRYDYFHYRYFYRHPTGNILNPDALVIEPFFDSDLLNFAFRLPPDMRSKGRLYKKMILNRFQNVASVGYSDTDRPLSEATSGSREQLARTMRQLRRRVSRRLGQYLPALRSGPTGDDPASAIYYNDWLRTASRSFVNEVIDENEAALSIYLDMPRVRQLVSDHMSGRVNEFRLVGALVTTALSLQMF